MTIANVKVTFLCPIEKVWSVVTNLSDQSWRSDIDRVEVIDETNFVEYAKGGFRTMFKTTFKEHHKQWEFDLENKNIEGHWIGIFHEHDGKTTLDFTEKVRSKNIFLTPLIGKFLKKQQRQYFVDLKKVLQCQEESHF